MAMIDAGHTLFRPFQAASASGNGTLSRVGGQADGVARGIFERRHAKPGQRPTERICLAWIPETSHLDPGAWTQGGIGCCGLCPKPAPLRGATSARRNHGGVAASSRRWGWRVRTNVAESRTRLTIIAGHDLAARASSAGGYGWWACACHDDKREIRVTILARPTTGTTSPTTAATPKPDRSGTPA